LLKPVWAIIRDALPARAHVQLDHFRFHGCFANLNHPRTFSEKIAFRKLYDRDPRIPLLVDKIAAREQMASRFGADFVIPALAVYESAAQVGFAALQYPCVVKPNHASGFNVFLPQRPQDENAARRKLAKVLRHRHERESEEWAYGQIMPRLLAEPWIESRTEPRPTAGPHGLIDYKLHTFHGHVFAIQVDLDRHTNHTRSFFDPEWNAMPFELLYPRPSHAVARPQALAEMIRRAEQIGEGFAYVRVDLYEIEGRAKFGEATFYPGAGLEVFKPREFDALFGAQWE
jgi:hypothetical protein